MGPRKRPLRGMTGRWKAVASCGCGTGRRISRPDPDHPGSSLDLLDRQRYTTRGVALLSAVSVSRDSWVGQAVPDRGLKSAMPGIRIVPLGRRVTFDEVRATSS